MVFKPSSVSWPITAKRSIERLSSITPLQRRRYAILLACTILLLGLLLLILFSMWRLSLQQNTLLTPFRKLIAMHPGAKYYWASPNELVVCKNSIQIGTTARQLILTSVNYTPTDATYALAAKGSVLLGSLVVHTSSLSPSIFPAQSPSYDDWPRMFYKVPGKNTVSFSIYSIIYRPSLLTDSTHAEDRYQRSSLKRSLIEPAWRQIQ